MSEFDQSIFTAVEQALDVIAGMIPRVIEYNMLDQKSFHLMVGESNGARFFQKSYELQGDRQEDYITLADRVFDETVTLCDDTQGQERLAPKKDKTGETMYSASLTHDDIVVVCICNDEHWPDLISKGLVALIKEMLILNENLCNITGDESPGYIYSNS